MNTRSLSDIPTVADFRSEMVSSTALLSHKAVGALPLTDFCGSRAQLEIQVLLVEDDEKIACSIKTRIESEGGKVVRSEGAEEASELLSRTTFDVVLLDIMLPGKNGLQMLMEMRANRITTPVLLLSARDTVGDRVLGLDSGADDYLVKPFVFAELLARIRALTRRNKPNQPEPLRCTDLEIDAQTCSATRARIPLTLTRREFEILAYLCRHQGHIVTREMLACPIFCTSSIVSVAQRLGV